MGKPQKNENIRKENAIQRSFGRKLENSNVSYMNGDRS